MENVDVVVVGAGPTGLLLALELALAGASTVVLERLAEPDQTIKAGGLGALAGEALERRGFGDDLAAEERGMGEAMAAMTARTGAPPFPARMLERAGGHFAGLFLIDQTRQRQPQRRMRGVRQQGLERMLGARAAARGIDVRRAHEVIDFRDEGDHVSVTARGPGGEVSFRGAYLVGCDGGRSGVRKRAGFDFPGTDPTLTGHQAIVELDHPERLLPLGWRRTPVGMMAYGPVPGRIFLAEFDGPPADRDAPVTIEEVQRSLRRVSGADVTITAMKTATRFTDHARQATSYRRGRVLLAGDAAHVHSPFGGQGLNLSLLDAVNLGWKLAATLAGWAPPHLVDSYTAERHPVAARVLANTRAQAALMRPDALTTELREIIAQIMTLDEGNRFFGELISGITTRYDLGDAHPLVGTLAADRALAPETGAASLYAAMVEGAAVLVDGGDGEAAARAAAWSSVDVRGSARQSRALPRAPRVRALRSPGAQSLLVRPDGCVAWARDAGDVEGLAPAMERWLGPPVAG